MSATLGISGLESPLGDPDEWWRTFEVNVLGLYLCCNAFAPGMVERGGGRIVNIASGAAYLPPRREPANPPPTGQVKAAVHRFSELLAADLAAKNVFVFSISPGLVNGDDERLPRRRALDTARARPAAHCAPLRRGEFDALAGRYLAPSTTRPSRLREQIDKIPRGISTPFAPSVTARHNESEQMRIALAQINPIVSDLAGFNRDDSRAARGSQESQRGHFVLFPELAVTGYPPEDLLLRPGFVRAAEDSLKEIARSARGIVAVVRSPHFDHADLYNACAVCAGGEVKAFVRKRFLPNYGVFDEFRATSRRAPASTSSSSTRSSA